MSLQLSARNALPAATGLLMFAAAALTLGRAATTPAASSSTSGTAYVTGFRLPGFGEDGFKAWEIQGQRAQAAANDTSLIQVTDMKLVRYAGGQTLNIESTIECAHATVHTDKTTNETSVSSPEKLYIYDGANSSYRVTGNDWTWDGNAAQLGVAPTAIPVSDKPVIHIGSKVYVEFTAAAASSSQSAGAAAGQKPPQPVVILSDTLEIYQLETDNRFVFTGNIDVKEGDTHTTCHWLEVLAQRSSAPNPAVATTAHPTTAPVNLEVGHIERIVAKDQVVVSQSDPTKGDFTASGGQAEFNPGAQSVVMTESPEIHAAASDTVLQGGRIIWKQDQQVMQVEPVAGTPGAPGRVSISLPPLASYQKDAPPSPPGGPRLLITGQSIVAQFQQGQQTFNVEKSVHVDDQDLKVDADHLDADFMAKTDSAPAVPSPTLVAPLGAPSSNPLPPMGQLNHLTVSGNATILQGSPGAANFLTTTTPRAEIIPSTREIDFNAGAHIVDGHSHAEIDGGRISLFNDGQNGTIETTPGRPATILFPSLRAAAAIGGADPSPVNTTVVSQSVTMVRGEEHSTFTFDTNVHVTASDYDSTCGQLVVTTNNVPAAPGDDPLTAPAKFGQITELQEINHVVVSQGAYQALAASAEIYPLAKVNPDAVAVAPAAPADQAYRLVQLHGDPRGITGPRRPEVDVPLQTAVDLSAPAAPPASPTAPKSGAPTTSANSPAKITSDEQWLMTNPVSAAPDTPAANTYYFNGNVHMDSDSFNATSDRMRAEGRSANGTDNKIAVERIIVEGHVTFVQGTTTITADRAEILPAKRTVTLTGNVIVKDPAKGRTSTSEHVVYNLDTHVIDTDSPPARPGEAVKRPTFTIEGGSAARH